MAITSTPLFNQDPSTRACTIIRCAHEANAVVIVAALFATNQINTAYHSFDSCIQSFNDSALRANGDRFQFGGLWFIEVANQAQEMSGEFLCNTSVPAGHPGNYA